MSFKRLMSVVLAGVLIVSTIGTTGVTAYASSTNSLSVYHEKIEDELAIDEVVQEEDEDQIRITDEITCGDDGIEVINSEDPEQADEVVISDESDYDNANEENSTDFYSIQPHSYKSGNKVSRIDWLRKLITTFGLSMDNCDYPDNYYSDIDEDYKYYDVVMTATNHGFVDVYPGEKFNPDGVATREFVAHTLNLCMGILKSSSSYSFAESSSVKYAEDIQAIIDYKLILLEDGKFLPTQAITEGEVTHIFDVVKQVKESEIITGENKYKFKSSVNILPEGTEIVTEDQGLLRIKNCTKKIKSGEILGMVYNGAPLAWSVDSTYKDGSDTMVKVSTVEVDKAFEYANFSTTGTLDFESIKTASDTAELYYVVGGDKANKFEDGEFYSSYSDVQDREISAICIHDETIVESSKTIDVVDGITVKYDAYITDFTWDYGVSIWEQTFFVSTDFNVIMSVEMEGDLAKFLGEDLHLCSIDIIPGVTYEASLLFNVKGSLKSENNYHAHVGLYHDGLFSGIRLERSFEKVSSFVSGELAGTMGFRFDIKLSVLVVKASLYVKYGIEAKYSRVTYNDSLKPDSCSDLSFWVFAIVGYSVDAFSKHWGDSIDLFDMCNSPTKGNIHFEDGKQVETCTNPDRYKKGIVQKIYPGYNGTGDKKGWNSPLDTKFYYNGKAGKIGSGNNVVTIFDYTVDSETGYATITEYQGNATNVFVPEKLDGHTVTAIGNRAFKNKNYVRSVHFPETITKIGDFAFQNCYLIEEIDIPDSVVDISYGAFCECSKLRKVKLSKNLTALRGGTYSHGGAFYGCTSLKEITIPKSLVTSGGAVFESSGLRTVHFEDGIKTIPYGLFSYCDSLEEISFPDTLTSIEGYSFIGDKNLKKVIFPESLNDIAMFAFANCESLEEIVIPDSVTEIWHGAFSGCKKLSSVKLSNNLEKLMGGSYSKGGAFYECESLKEITIPKSLITSGGAVFEKSGLKTVHFEEGVSTIPYGLFSECESLEEIVIPDTVTVIEAYAFKGDTNLKKVKLSNTLQKIDIFGFYKCKSIKEIVLPDSLTILESGAFSNCSSLEKVTLSKNLAELRAGYSNGGVFEACTSLKEIELPESLKRVESNVFYGCTGLEKITFRCKLATIPSGFCYGCSSLKSIEFPEGLVEILNKAYYDCDSLTKVTIPDGVELLGEDAFACCDKLSEVVVANSVTNIRKNCFEKCESLKQLSLSNSITAIPEGMCYSNASLESVIIPNGVTSIGKNAFSSCVKFTGVTIPRTVTSIADSAFSYYTKLTIYGVKGSYAETWAKQKTVKFVEINKPAKQVNLNKHELVISKGKSVRLNFSVDPADYTDGVVWESSDEQIIKVSDDGTVKSVGIGVATISIYVGDTAYDECKVSVMQPVTRVSLDKSSVSMDAYDTVQLKVSVAPDNAYDKTVTWKSSDEEVATVDQDGLITALAKGTTTITVTANDGSEKSSSCKVNVVRDVTNCKSWTELESKHNYESNSDIVWRYQQSGANELRVTFDENTAFVGKDYLYIYDGNKKLIGQYKEKELSGKTVTIPGDVVLLNLITDAARTAWGFKVTKISTQGESIETELEEPYVADSDGNRYESGISLEAGTRLYLVSSNHNAEIYYTTDKTEATNIPEDDAHLYKHAIEFTKDVTIYAKAVKEGFKSSKTVSFSFKLKNALSDWGEVLEEDRAGYNDADEIPKNLWVAGVSDADYTGSEIAFENMHVYYGKTLLKAGEDYTTKYTNNMKVSIGNKKAVITITGKGNYTGSKAVEFSIRPISLGDGKNNSKNLSVADIQAEYTGKKIQATTFATYNLNGKELVLKKGIDYVYDYSGVGVEPGEYVVKIVGKGNFTGTAYFKENVFAKNSKTNISKLVVNAIPAQKVDGEPKKPQLTITDKVTDKKNPYILTSEDYSARYFNNVSSGTATVVITGKGDKYAGTKMVTFKMEGLSIAKAKFDIGTVTYDGTPKEPSYTVMYQASKKEAVETLVEGIDYTVSVTNNVKKGNGTIIFTGMGRFSDVAKKTFVIDAHNFSSGDVTVSCGNNSSSDLKCDLGTFKYTKNGVTPSVKLSYKGKALKLGQDYKVKYASNKAVGNASMTITGIGNYSGSFMRTFAITGASLSDATVTATDIQYSEKAGICKPKIVVYDSNGAVLVAGKDYDSKDLTYIYVANTIVKRKQGSTLMDVSVKSGTKVDLKNDIIPAGTEVRVVIKGKGLYGNNSTNYADFDFVNTLISKANVKLNKGSYDYSGNKIEISESDLTVKVGNKVVPQGAYKIISIKGNNKVGTAQVTIAGVGKYGNEYYGGTKTVTFKITAKNIK